MKYLLPSLVFVPVLVWADCNTQAIEYYNESGFSISFGSGKKSTNFNDNQTINVPLTIDGKAACFRKKTSFQLDASDKKDEQMKKFMVTPMDIEFENVPNAHVKQYVFIETNPENKYLTKLHTMRFICSGDIPLSVEAASDKYYEVIAGANQANVQVTHVIATGIAAQNLNMGKAMTNNNQETFDLFSKLYTSKTQRKLEDVPACDMNIPSIITETTINSLSNDYQQIASKYTTMDTKVVNGCTKDFSETMKNYQLENFKDNESLSDFKVKKKTFGKQIVFEWKN